MKETSSDKVSQWRDDLQLEGIPFTWSTNLTDEGIKEVYQILLRERFLIRLKEDGITPVDNLSIGVGFQITISENGLFTEIEYKDRICLVVRPGDNSLTVNALTKQEYEEWRREQEEENRKWEEEERAREEHNRKRTEFYNICRELTDKCCHLIESHFFKEAEKKCRELMEFELNSSFLTGHSDGVGFLFQIYSETKNLEGGYNLINELKGYFEDRALLLDFANAFECEKDIDNSKTVYERALTLFPDDGEIYKRVAMMYERSGKYSDAIEICSKAIDRKLHDGTKSGFEGRIKRIKKKQVKDSNLKRTQ